MRRLLAAGLLFLSLAPLLQAVQSEGVIDVRTARSLSGSSFEALWLAYRRAEASGDAENTKRILDEIRRLRIERNIRSLEQLALVFVGRGLAALEKGDQARAQEEFQRALAVDPHLPDAYFGLASAELKRIPLGFLPALKHVLEGLASRLPTSRGRHYLLTLLIVVGLLAALATTMVFALSMLMRYGTLLLHDLEEFFAGRSRALSVGLYGVLLVLPLLAFQGYGWLPLWWLALLHAYASTVERVASYAILAASVAVGPAVSLLESGATERQNPLFRASMLAVEDGADARAIADLEAASRKDTDDADLAYLLAIEYKKAGQYDDAVGVYRDLLRRNDGDPIALNNLANLEFTRQEFPAAITRYKLAKMAAEGTFAPEVAATIYYNLSLAHLQKFQRQEADEARAQADRLGGALPHVYDTLWKYESRNENAVVDLGLNQEQVQAKFTNARQGVVRKNVAGRDVPGSDIFELLRSAANRFLAFIGVFALVVFLMGRWRGARTFTMRCQKCGTPFCKRCHLGAAPSGLCTQCFHLFVVRDGVSGPARNQKLLEVQKEDERRERVFRALSLVSPGTGHLYAQKTLTGLLFAFVWYALLALVLLAGHLLPVTEAPAMLLGSWVLIFPAVVLLGLYVAANRARPDFEISMPMARGGPRRGRAA